MTKLEKPKGTSKKDIHDYKELHSNTKSKKDKPKCYPMEKFKGCVESLEGFIFELGRSESYEKAIKESEIFISSNLKYKELALINVNI